MARKDFKYANAENCLIGKMICAQCHKPIDEGWFRYRETRDHYICHHRKCSEDDPAWSAFDKDVQAQERRRDAITKDILQLTRKHKIKDRYEMVGWVEEAFGFQFEFNG